MSELTYARARAARLLLRYLDTLDDESARELLTAVHQLEAAKLLASAPSQQEGGRALAERYATAVQ